MSKNSISVVDDSISPAKTVLLLAWPVFLEQILVSLAGYVDTAMVGSLGKAATAAVSISNSPMMLLNGLIMALGVGFTALISRAVGADDLDWAKRLMRQAMVVVMALGIPIAIIFFALGRHIPIWMGGAPEILDNAATYNRIVACSLPFRTMSMILTAQFRGFGNTRTPMVVNIMANVINVAGNFFLIFPTRVITVFGAAITMPGAGWGVAGAAVPTAASAIFGGTVMFLMVFLRKGPMQLTFKGNYRPDWAVLRQVSRISLPAALERLTMSTASILSTSNIATLGTTAVAANSLALTAESMCWMPGFAMGTAATTLVGQALGAKRPELAHKYVKTTVTVAALVMAVFGTLLFIFATPILRIFTPDADVIALGTRCLQITALIQVPQVIATVLSGGMRGAGDTRWSFFIISGSNWALRLPIAIISIRLLGFGLEAAYVAMCVDICGRCLGLFLRYRTGKWKTVLED